MKRSLKNGFSLFIVLILISIIPANAIAEDVKDSSISEITDQAFMNELNTSFTKDSELELIRFTADKPSGQPIKRPIFLEALARGGTTPYEYKFYYELNGITTVLSNFSILSATYFVPLKAGVYNLYVDVKDKTGNIDRKSMSYSITPTADINCFYHTHIQNIGWQETKENGEISGTFGQGLRLEAIQIIARDSSDNDIGIKYQTHIQNIGWQEWQYGGSVSGTSGQGLRLEAIRIQLTGTEAANYDVFYQVHAENFGWLDWAENGAAAGTEGFGYRLEAIKIKFVPKGSSAPGSTDRPFVKKN